MPSMDTENGMFLLEHTINTSGDKNIQLNTQNTFVDQDILIKITTPPAANFSLDISDNTTDNVTVGNLNTTTNKYQVTATIGGTLTAGTAGWFTSGSGTETGVKVGLVPKATFALSNNKFYCNSAGYITAGSASDPLDSITAVTPTASINTGTSNDYNGLTTYFTKLSNSTGANVTIKPQYSTSAGYVSSATDSITNGNITYWQIKTATPAFDGGTVSGTATASSSTATLSESTNTSGISISTGGTANRTAVLYNGAVEGWVSKADNATALAAPGTAANLTSKTYYINAVSVPQSKTFAVTNAGTVNITHSTSGKGSVSITPYGGSSIQIVNNGAMLTSTITTPTWSKNSSTKVATMDSYSWTSGYITNGSVAPATFKNTATSGKTYVDLSDALVSAGGANVIPEISEDGYLYIDKGYVDYIRISLARLIPGTEPSSGALAAGHILQGYSAYDKDGNLITGSIVQKTASNVTFDGATRTFTAPAGYYASDATKQIAAASLTPGNGSVSLTSDTNTLSIYSSTNTHGIEIGDSAPGSSSGKVYIKVTGNGAVSNTVGWLNTATSTTSNNKVRYISLNKYAGAYTIT